MVYLIICSVALATAFLTLFSGFGLGTLLMPAFALFFPMPIAIASTAVVHGLNNALKLLLLYQYVNKSVVIKFGIPAMIFAVLGALTLNYLFQQESVFQWHVLNVQFQTSKLKFVIGALILIFTLFDLFSIKKRVLLDPKWLPLGGILSGYFGGLSGHQGAFRAMFLLKCGLSPKEFVATQSVLASLVDATRLIIYFVFIFFASASTETLVIDHWLIIFATLSAFAGTFIGKRLLEKTKIAWIHHITAVMLLLVSFSLLTGLI